MLKEPTPEREKEIIDRVAKLILNEGLAGFLNIFWEYGFKFFGNLVTSYAMFELFPFSPLLGSMGPDFAIFLQTDPVGNMERIVERVRELDDQKKQEEAAKRAAEGNKPRVSFWQKIKSYFSRK